MELSSGLCWVSIGSRPVQLSLPSTIDLLQPPQLKGVQHQLPGPGLWGRDKSWGRHCSPVTRLRLTWQCVPKQVYMSEKVVANIR